MSAIDDVYFRDEQTAATCFSDSDKSTGRHRPLIMHIRLPYSVITHAGIRRQVDERRFISAAHQRANSVFQIHISYAAIAVLRSEL